MISPYQARLISKAMADVTLQILGRSHSAAFSAKNASVAARVGGGKKTYHQRKGSTHVITFGPDMVASKANGEGANWLSGKEIKCYGFYNGDLSLSSLLAHTILHEFAHALQTLAGERHRGSVHNAAFYRILNDLHRDFGGDVRTALRSQIAALSIDLDNLDSTAMESAQSKPDLRDFRIGDSVRIDHNGRVAVGRVVRVNQKSLSVDGFENGRKTKCRVSPQLATKLANGEYLKLMEQHSLAGQGQHLTLRETPPPRMTYGAGDRVSFLFRGRKVTGKVVRVNPKTCTIETDEGQGYRVSPALLKVA